MSSSTSCRGGFCPRRRRAADRHRRVRRDGCVTVLTLWPRQAAVSDGSHPLRVELLVQAGLGFRARPARTGYKVTKVRPMLRPQAEDDPASRGARSRDEIDRHVALGHGFSRHAEIYRDGRSPPVPRHERQGRRVLARRPRTDRSEFPTGYSSAGCSPAEPASASPVAPPIPRRQTPSQSRDRKPVPDLRVSVERCNPPLTKNPSYKGEAHRGWH